jgi:hypothetical protein
MTLSDIFNNVDALDVDIPFEPINRPADLWQALIDADVSEQDIEQRLVAGISLKEQYDELQSEYDYAA